MFIMIFVILLLISYPVANALCVYAVYRNIDVFQPRRYTDRAQQHQTLFSPIFSTLHSEERLCYKRHRTINTSPLYFALGRSMKKRCSFGRSANCGDFASMVH
jgi:hypothetical protein